MNKLLDFAKLPLYLMQLEDFGKFLASYGVMILVYGMFVPISFCGFCISVASVVLGLPIWLVNKRKGPQE